MSKTNYLKLLSVLLLITILVSCGSKKNNIANYIPKDVGLMITVDMKSFNEKGKLGEFTKTKMYNSAKQNLSVYAPKEFQKIDEILQNTDVIGLNLKSDFYLFMNKKADLFGMLFEMKDKSKFAAFLKKFEKELKTSKEPEKLGDFLAVIDGDMILGWNDEVLYYMAFTCEDNTPEKMKEQFKKITTQKPEESVAENADFKEFIQGKKDISLWFDMDMLADVFKKTSSYMPGFEFKNVVKLLTGSSIYIYTDFATDEIVTKVVGKYSDEFKKLIDPAKVYTNNFNAELLKYVPADAFGVYTISMDMKEAKKGLDKFYQLLIEDLKVAASQETELSEMNTLMELLVKLIDNLDGNIVYSFNDMTMADANAPDEYMGRPEPKPAFMLLMGLKDPSILDAVIAEAKIPLVKEGNFYTNADGMQKIYLGVVKNMLVFSTDLNTVKNIEAGELANNILSSQYKEQLSKGNFGYMNLNFDKFPQGMKGLVYNPMIPPAMIEKANIFDVVTTEIDTKTSTTTMTLKYKKTNTNSFYALIKMIDNLVP